jgi:hypothetical protein
MALAILFTPASMNTSQYDECIRQLDQAGAAAPQGRLFHACYGSGDRLQVFDIWDSQETFVRFGEKLMPILQRLGVDPGPPQVSTLHNTLS